MWEYLLQGRKFTVRTDHNLRYMPESPPSREVETSYPEASDYLS
jgi:hypothetical protein